MVKRAQQAIVRGFVRRVGQAREQREEPPAGWRRAVVLQAIFRAMPRRLDRRRIQGEEAVVEWRVRDGEGGVDIWTLRIEDGSACIRRGGAERPRLRIEADTGDFFALAAGQADGMKLWTNGDLTVEGDLLYAARLAGMFRVPRRRSGGG